MLVVHLLGVDKQSEQVTDVPGTCCWFSEQNWVRDLIKSVEQQWTLHRWRPICCSCVSSNLVDPWSWWRIGTTRHSIQLTQSSASRWLLGAGSVWPQVRTRPCKVQHHKCPKSLCGEVEFTSTFRNKIIEITTKLSPCHEYKGVRIEVETRFDSKSPESWMEGGWEGELVKEEQVNSLMW